MIRSIETIGNKTPLKLDVSGCPNPNGCGLSVDEGVCEGLTVKDCPNRCLDSATVVVRLAQGADAMSPHQQTPLAS